MKRLIKFENFNYSYSIGLNINTICNINEGKEILQNLYSVNINIDDHKIYDYSKPYNNSIITINDIHNYLNNINCKLYVFSITKSDKVKSSIQKWIENFNFKFDDIIFIQEPKEIWNYVDIVIDNYDKVLNSKPLKKISIKIEDDFNDNSYSEYSINSLNNISINMIKNILNKL